VCVYMYTSMDNADVLVVHVRFLRLTVWVHCFLFASACVFNATG